MFLNSLNYFRAIAIIFIVFGHSFWLADFEFITVFFKTYLHSNKSIRVKNIDVFRNYNQQLLPRQGFPELDSL